MNKTCLVLGARGFVGSAIVAEAQTRGFSVIPVTRQDYDQHRGTACDLLVNANGNSKKYLATEDPARDYDLSVASVMRSLADFKPQRYIHLSTIDVYSNHSDPAQNREDAVIDPARLSPYGLHKQMAEQLVMKDAANWTIFRMGGFVGPGLKKNSVYDLLKGAHLRVNPDSQYQYMDSRNLARIVFDLESDRATHCAIFNICGEGLISPREITPWIPKSTLDGAPTTAAPERYEVNIDKLKSLHLVPFTRSAVRNFVEDVQAGRVQIA